MKKLQWWHWVLIAVVIFFVVKQVNTGRNILVPFDTKAECTQWVTDYMASTSCRCTYKSSCSQTAAPFYGQDYTSPTSAQCTNTLLNCNAACGCGTTSCESPNTQCTSGCVNLQTDVNNCGTCSHACSSGQTCNAGVCITSSGNSCTDTDGGLVYGTKGTVTMTCVGFTPQTVSDYCAGNQVTEFTCNNVDYTNCLGLGVANTCSNGCLNGACVACPKDTCKVNQLDVCVDLKTDILNCGTCGHQCTTSQTCVNGACTSSCTPTCAGKACGAYDGCTGICLTGSCANSGTCVSGQCIADVCTPSCTGKVCGADNGCGDICLTGTCTTGTCTNGVCKTTTCASGGSHCAGNIFETTLCCEGYYCKPSEWASAITGPIFDDILSGTCTPVLGKGNHLVPYTDAGLLKDMSDSDLLKYSCISTQDCEVGGECKSFTDLKNGGYITEAWISTFFSKVTVPVSIVGGTVTGTSVFGICAVLSGVATGGTALWATIPMCGFIGGVAGGTSGYISYRAGDWLEAVSARNPDLVGICVTSGSATNFCSFFDFIKTAIPSMEAQSCIIGIFGSMMIIAMMMRMAMG